MDGHPFLTHGTFGVPTLVASVGNDRVLGLALETGFNRLTMAGHDMMAFVISTLELAVTQGTRPGTTHKILTVKSTARGTTPPLTGMIGPIVGVELSFTV